MAGGTVHVPWYATGFRGDGMADAVSEIAAVALRYGATDYRVYRSRDDRYRILQTAAFPDKLDFERYWYGEEFSAWRIEHSSWFQVPIVYVWHDLVAEGHIDPGAQAPVGAGAHGAASG